MKKYTNKILTCGLIIFFIIYLGFFYAIFRELKNGKINDENISDPEKTMTITSTVDENGKTQIIAKRTENGETKTIAINPNTDYFERVETTPADTAK